MTASSFSRSLKRVLVHEGGKVDDPHDPGGRTAYGVTQRVYDAWRDSRNEKRRDVYDIDKTEVGDIYKRRYWSVIGGDRLPLGLDYVVFDGAVNSGAAQSVKWLQRSLGPRYGGKIDGQMGMMTLDAIAAFPDHDELIDLICARRLAFMMALKTWPRFKRGWQRRVESVEATGQAWAMGSVGPPAVYIPGAEARANLEDARPMPVMAVADAAGGGGGTLAALAQGINQVKDDLAQFADVGFVSNILLALTLAGVALLVGGFGYRWYAARRQAALKDALDLDAAPRRADAPPL